MGLGELREALASVRCDEVSVVILCYTLGIIALIAWGNRCR